MNITELRYLVAILQWGSVSAAAKHLYVAQPNVSKALKNLEEAYHLRIFDRTPTGMQPTEPGRRFIAQAKRVLEEVDRLEQGVDPPADQALLRVALPHAAYMAEAVQDLLDQIAQASRIQIQILECSASAALEQVLRHGYHLAVLRFPVQDQAYFAQYCSQRKLEMEEMLDFRYGLLTSRDSPLATHLVQDLAELDQYAEVMDGERPGSQGAASFWHANPQRQIHLYQRSSQLAALRRMPCAYMWASPMPQTLLDLFHLVIRPCPAQQLTMRDVLIWPKDRPLSPEGQRLCQLLRQQATHAVR